MTLQRLDLNLLLALDALLTECNITHAGKKLHLSPSAVSGALARLRDYFGDELLSPLGRKMVLTPLGESLRQPVRDCLLQIQATLENRPTFDASTAQRRFRLMMSDYVATVIGGALLARLEKEAPGIRLELLENGERPWEVMARGEIDVLIVPNGIVHPEHPFEPLFEDDFVGVCWQENGLIGERPTVEECLSVGHVVARIGQTRPPTIDAWFFERFGMQRRVDAITMTFCNVPHLLVGTQRIGFMHRRLAETYSRALPLRLFTPPVAMPRLVESVQWHRFRDRDPGTRWLLGVLRDTVSAPAAR
jgi:LysR family transcriptional regulator, nod-box dependent transcriptional activator